MENLRHLLAVSVVSERFVTIQLAHDHPCHSVSVVDHPCYRPSVTRPVPSSPIADRFPLAVSCPCHLHSGFCRPPSRALASGGTIGPEGLHTRPKLAWVPSMAFWWAGLYSRNGLAIFHLAASSNDAGPWDLNIRISVNRNKGEPKPDTHPNFES
jgi:hypothetical protein